MRVIRLQYDGYRNLVPDAVEAAEGVNLIYGDNAQGKTNLVEGIWLFTGAKSFRGSKDGELTGFDKEFSRLKLDFYAGGREQNAELRVAGRRQAILNGVELKSPTQLAGGFCAVIFSPSHLSLIQDGPAARRKFLDIAIGQMWPKYIEILRRYTRAVTQRNAALKDLRFSSRMEGLMDIFDQSIAQFGGRLTEYRRRYVEALRRYAPEIYSGLSGGREKLFLSYLPAHLPAGEEDGQAEKAAMSVSARSEAYAAELLEALRAAREEDIRTGATSVGPHRDDMELTIDGLPVRSFGSQGQKRSAVLTLKLAEAEVLKNGLGEKPVILLDDVMSELDAARQDYILNHISGWQVFITCCDPAPIQRLTGGRSFHMESGRISWTDMSEGIAGDLGTGRGEDRKIHKETEGERSGKIPGQGDDEDSVKNEV